MLIEGRILNIYYVGVWTQEHGFIFTDVLSGVNLKETALVSYIYLREQHTNCLE
jgi:hypothetical protein